MKTLKVFLLLFLFHTVSGFSLDISDLESELEKTAIGERKIELYLTLADTLLWTGINVEKGKSYAEKVVEICQDFDCDLQKLFAQGLIAEIEINNGEYNTVENVVLPFLKNSDPNLSNDLLSFFQELAGLYYIINGNSMEAITNLSAASKILENINPYSKRLGRVYYYLSFAHNINGTNEKSIEFSRKSIHSFVQLKDTVQIIDAKSGLSTLLATDGQFTEAIELLLESIEIAELKDMQGLTKPQLYNALIDVYIRNGNYEQAEEFYHKIHSELFKINLPVEQKAVELWSLHMSYAKLMGRMNRVEEGLRHVDSSYLYGKNMNAFTERITDLRKIGLLVSGEKYEIAESYINTLLEKLKSHGNADAVNAVLVGLLSKIYSNSSLEPNDQIVNELLPTVDRIIEKNEDQYNLDILDAEKLSTIFGLYIGDKNRALKSFSNVNEIKDSLSQSKNVESNNELIVQYETKEKEKLIEIQRLSLEQKTLERNSLIGFSLAAILAMGIILLFYFQKKSYADQLEKEVDKRTAQLQQSNQDLNQSKEELERYNYIASHDLKEPLRNVVSFVNVIKRKGLIESEEVQEYFNYIEKGAIQMNKIVQDLVTFSNYKNHQVKFQKIKTTELLETVKENIFYEGVTTKNFPEEIISDKKALQVIFSNLIENSLKFNESESPFVNIEYQRIEGNHVFEFIDNGIGIEKEYHEQVFDLFKRLNDRSKYSGSGVGLAICKELLTQIKGEISLKENLYGGTSFTIKIAQGFRTNYSNIQKKEITNEENHTTQPSRYSRVTN